MERLYDILCARVRGLATMARVFTELVKDARNFELDMNRAAAAFARARRVNTTEFTILETLRETVPAERWAAFLALARYMTKNPEQRMGQALVNVLQVTAPGVFYASDDDAAK